MSEDRERLGDSDVERASEGDVEGHKLGEGRASEGRSSEGKTSEGRASEGHETSGDDDVEGHVLHPKTSEG